MGSDDVNTQKDYGTKKKTPFQLQSLENFYSEDKYPKQKAMEDYAASLNLTYNQTRTWFVERRRKERKENEVLVFAKKNIHGSGRVREPHRSCVKSYGNNMNENSSLFADLRQVGQKDNLPVPTKKKKSSSSGQREINAHSSKSGHPHAQELTRMLKKYCTVSSNNHIVGGKDGHNVLGQWSKHRVPLQVLFSKDFIMKRVFRKDGPPLGVEFDPLPANTFCADSRNLHSSRDDQSIAKRRKVVESPIRDPGTLLGRNIPAKKHGIGKGLMTVWRATNSEHEMLPIGINLINERTALMPFRSNVSSKVTLRQVSKELQQLKRVPKQKNSRKKLQEKRKPPKKKREVPYSKDKNQKKPRPPECRLSVDGLQSLEQSNELMILVDDEELELRELQAASNPLTCSAHLASNGRHGCRLCKDLLARFPPQTVKMKQPFCTRPWDSSPELVKKLFKVFRFLYSHAMTIEVCSFSLDEFAQAFHDKDSLLLGKIHVALLKMLLLDAERERTAGSISRASKDCRFLGFLHFVREQEFDVNFWSRSLNSLTWTEILRQVLIAAGFGSKNNSVRKEMLSKERNRMVKYGLRPRTLKGELFCILSEKGSGGLKVSDLAKASQIGALDLPNTEEIEQLISSTLSSDITLFEKIAPSAYRLRVDPHIKGKEDSQSDTEDSGSVDDEDASRSSSSDESDDSEELNSAICERRIVKYKVRSKTTRQKLIEYTEIDESYSGEGWVLGLMEGEYSNLSIEEKLDTLIALVDLAGSGCSLRMEEPIKTIATINPETRHHGSGAKVKKASASHHLLLKEAWEGPAHGVEETHPSPDSFPIHSSEIFSKASKKGHSCARIKNTVATKESGPNVHPLRSIFLGSDRRYNNYWLFLGPCNANDPGHRRVYFESSEDGHWEVIDTAQALHALLSVLDCRGSRESHLFASLEIREAVLCLAMDDYMTAEIGSRQSKGSDPSDIDHSSGVGSSPISDIDNVPLPAESASSFFSASGAIVLEIRKNGEEKKQKWDRLQAFDKWIWDSFYSSLNAVKNSKKSFMESLARCESCHDLFWRDEKHCRICHSTFEVDFNLEERYAIHRATCRETEDSSEFPKHKVLPSQLQALKAAIHAIEMGMPEAALASAWTRSGHKLWVKRLRRTSSLPELLQVLIDFVGAINEEWLYEGAFALNSSTTLDEVMVYFQTMPQTTSAVALWMVKLDMLIAPHLERLQSERIQGSIPQSKRKRACAK